jgi:LacI family transcriptional regulator
MELLGLGEGPAVASVAFAELAGRDAARLLLARNPELTAVVAANDLIALGTIEANEELGRSCPGQLSVVGFNDMPFVERFRPPLTTVRIPEYEIGRRAAQLILSRIEQPAQHSETILIAPLLVVRGSTHRPSV